MIVTVHQPNYLPYLGYFDKMAKADVLVLYDTAEFVKRMFYHRNKIKTPEDVIWLTIPVKYKANDKPEIRSIAIENQTKWGIKQWQMIANAYRRSTYFQEVSDVVEEVFRKEWHYLTDVSVELITRIKDYLELDTKLVRASSLDIDWSETSTKKLVLMCQAVGGTKYLSGKTGKTYLKEEEFAEANIELEYQNYTHPVYQQHYGDFTQNLCILDLLFNEGKGSRDILIN